MFDIFILTDIEMTFTGREKASCVLEYAQSQSNMTAACIREGVLKTVANSNADLDMPEKFKEKVDCAGEKDPDDQKHQERRSSVFVENPVKPKVIPTKKKSDKTLIPPTTFWRILRKRLIMKPYKPQLVLATTVEDRRNPD